LHDPLPILGAGNGAVACAVEARIRALRTGDPDNTAAIPVDLMTASARDLDPETLPAAAQHQVCRVASARDLPARRVQQLVADQTRGRSVRLLGETRFNVLQLNLALDAPP
jgi:K+-transporting ATPase ATPase C chain